VISSDNIIYMKALFKIIFISILIVNLLPTSSYAQGFHGYFGSSSMTNGLTSITPEGQSHPGFVLGADARLNEGDMYFVLGLQYHKNKLAAQSDFELFPSGESINFVKFRVGLGYDVIHISKLMTIRGKTLASIDMISGVPANFTPAYNDGVAGIVLGLGTDVSVFTFDIEYELGLFNGINKVDGSKISFINFVVGMVL